MSAPIKKPDSPLDPYWTRGQVCEQQDAFSLAVQNPYVQVKRLHRDTSLQATCDRLIDGGYRGTLTFTKDQRERVMEFAHSEAHGAVMYRGCVCAFRDLAP